ncbi:hypothetical protein PENTCL1PPCAC_2989 [Pristionchus entomophagus]|uniref:Uncharacterized protein n=1 Tax=Pristionchus entomophagus TaxID=358040 RepID=A0AAV5SL39_9BILA|nr:hypothetical protein PENTCL1PPCAC_2989 [Pristionchus entomophagus]
MHSHGEGAREPQEELLCPPQPGPPPYGRPTTPPIGSPNKGLERKACEYTRRVKKNKSSKRIMRGIERNHTNRK